MDRKRLLLTAILLALMLISAGSFPGAAGAPAPTPLRAGQVEAPQEILLTTAERKEVLEGRIVLRRIPERGRKGRTYEVVGILEGALEEVFGILTDYRAYPEFQDTVTIISVRKENESDSIVEFSLDLPLGMKKKFRMRYSAQKGDGEFRVSWQKLPWPELKPRHTVADSSGHWLVRKFDEGRVLALARVHAEPGPVPLGLTGLAHLLSRKSMPGMIRSVRRRLRQLREPTMS